MGVKNKELNGINSNTYNNSNKINTNDKNLIDIDANINIANENENISSIDNDIITYKKDGKENTMNADIISIIAVNDGKTI